MYITLCTHRTRILVVIGGSGMHPPISVFVLTHADETYNNLSQTIIDEVQDVNM